MRHLSYKKQKQIMIITFLFIPLFLLLLFSYYPALKLFQLSFAEWDGMSRDYRYVGFANYIDVFKDSSIFMTFSNNLAYGIVAIFQNAIALYFAILLNGRVKAKNFFKSTLFLPYILNGVAVAFMFSFMYNFEQGPINVLLRNLGLENLSIHWLGQSYFSNFSLAFLGLWKYMGLNMVIFFGALQSIPVELYESSDIDGANYFQKIRYIVMPSIKLVIEINLFMAINGAFQAFFEPFIMTKGGPGGRTATFVTSTIDVAFKFQNFGKASAMAVLLMFIVIIVLGLQRKILKS